MSTRVATLWARLVAPAAVFLADLGLVAAAALGSRLPLRDAARAERAGGPAGDFARFMAVAGLLCCAFFALAVLAFALPRLVLHPCAQY